MPEIEMTDFLKLMTRTADGVFAVDADDRIILWNQAAVEALGFTPKEVLGRFCYEVLPGTDLCGNFFCFKGCSVMTMARKGQPVRNYDLQVLTKDHRKVWLNVSILLVPNPGRRKPLIVHLFHPLSNPGNLTGMAEQMAATVLAGLKSDNRVPRRERFSLQDNGSPLSQRETEILYLMAQCTSTKEIAARLCISYTTVRTHIKHILEKFNAHNKLEAVTLAIQKGLVK